MIKVTKKVVFGGVNLTVYPGTLCKILHGRNRDVTYAVPVNQNIINRGKKKYRIAEGGLPFWADEFVLVK